MLLPRPFKLCHTRTDLIWSDGPFKLYAFPHVCSIPYIKRSKMQKYVIQMLFCSLKTLQQ